MQKLDFKDVRFILKCFFLGISKYGEIYFMFHFKITTINQKTT